MMLVKNGGSMKKCNPIASILSVAAATLCMSMWAQAGNQTQSTQIFTAMDADIASMWQQRDMMAASFQKLDLIQPALAHDLHDHHDHHNEHGVGGDSDVDDIDVLASDDVLADKISELAANDKSTAFDSADSLGDLSAAITVPAADLQFEQPKVKNSSGHLLGVRPVANARVTSKYGYRRIFGKSQFHKGIDLAAKYGSPIYATGAGKVVYAGWMRGYGRFVEIDHENGYKTRYAHSARLHVKKGDYVEQNQRIADLGCSGRCTGPHLHYEVKKNGKHMNPNIFLAMAPAR